MKNKLTRSSNEKVIAGVCAGVARYFGWEPYKFRLIFIIISVFSAGFPGILVYLILWFLMPEESSF